MPKLLIISYELPLILDRTGHQHFEITPKSDAITMGLEDFYRKQNAFWIGRPGIDRGDIAKDERKRLEKEFLQNRCHPIYTGKKENERFLDGFSNRTLWPLFHYFTQNAVYREDYWKNYVKVNRKYADKAISLLKPGDSVWIHDYHLMLVPQMIREEHPGMSIGFFLHITFPSYEIFRLLPWRQEILSGLLGADLVGFHTYDYERHFMSCVRRLLGYDSVFNRIHLRERIVRVDFFPLGIDFKRFSGGGSGTVPEHKVSGIQKDLLNLQFTGRDMKLILSIDRLDYTKGPTVRLKAFEYFLKSYPRYLEKVSLLFFVMPSRESQELYKSLKKELDELVGRINSAYGTLNWVPVWYFYRQLDVDERMDLYTQSDIALITPIRDGMNLIAKEYLSTRSGRDGVLIISEMAGASKELSEAIIVNPNNHEEISQSIKCALEMSEERQIEANRMLTQRLSRYTVEKWAIDFINSLGEVRKIQEIKLAKKITPGLIQTIAGKYAKAQSRILFLDYDGTLMGFNKDPQKVIPDKELYQLLKTITGIKKNKIVLISGRDKETLSKWFPAEWNLDIVAEHGVWTREPNGEFSMIEQIDKKWLEIIRPILEFYVDRTPRSFIETKNYSLVWHYRNADPDLGNQRSWELKDELKALVANLNLEIMDGDKVIEIKNSGINKGRAAMIKIGDTQYDFILALGDDWTDEYTFDALPDDAFTIKVGTKTTKANYYVEGIQDVRVILRELAESGPEKT
jgi:trehalose 6-phosphate synthase/phosphatase